MISGVKAIGVYISIPGGIGPYNCGALSQEKWTKPTSAGELFGDFICNRGQETVTFNGNDILTVKVAWSLVVDKVRKQYYEEGTYPNPMDFGDPGAYIAEWADLLYDPNEFPIAQIIGSFDISIAADGTDRIRFVLSNRTDLASGTHFIGRFPPPDHEYDPYTLEDYIHDHPGEADSSAGQIINTHRDIVAILRPRTRNELLPGMAGGNYYQYFIWTERHLGCEALLPWPLDLFFLDFGN